MKKLRKVSIGFLKNNMKKITHPVYADYPEQPYISPDRDLKLWEEQPEKFPYKKVERSKMVRLDEGVLPGDIVMLWRVGFGNFTTDTHIPDYFEYRYGVNSDESLELLIDLGYIEKMGAQDTLHLLNSDVIKRILKANALKVSGKKQEILDRALTQIEPQELEKAFDTRRYKITSQGKDLLKKYDDIIIKHGPKML